MAAERLAVEPLQRESVEVLELSETQAEDMEDFLAHAWVVGALAGHANMTSKVLEGPLELGDFEEQVRPLVEDSADVLNLTVNQTMRMWDFLAQAMVAGVKASEAELTAMLIEHDHDIPSEALDWLEKRRDGEEDEPEPS